MEERRKQEIRKLLEAWCARFPSRNRAADSLRGVSAATLCHLLNGKWENIAVEMWENVASQIVVGGGDWQIEPITVYRELTALMTDAQQQSLVYWAVGDAGCGKSTAALAYRATHRNTFLVLCSEDMSRGDFVRELACALGTQTEGLTVRRMLDEVIVRLSTLPRPLVIFDEADKLTDAVFHYFITIYNRLDYRCGMLLLSTGYIRRRMENGLRYNKKGYREIMSRVGRRFYDLERTAPTDVYAVCRANGLADGEAIADVIHDSERCDFDLRRVRRAVHRELRRKGAS